MDSLDLLFIHVPKFSNHYKPYGEYMTTNLIPMGTFGLADLVHREGYRTKILHLGLEWIERRTFSPLPFLEGKSVEVVALPLHFHPQAYDVMKIAGELKEGRPETFILLGGYTASFFHHEILNHFPQVDAIIRGDAEMPILQLLKALKGRSSLEEVANLTWRDGATIRINPLTYVASEKDLDHFSYTHLSLLHDRETYRRYMGIPFIWAKGLSKEENRRRFHLGSPLFPLNIGRGCSGNCTWCGGGSQAQQAVNGRKGVIFRSPESVVQSVGEALEMGYEMVHIAFDPGKEGAVYYRELFPLLRRENLRMKVYFESFSLPQGDFLEDFARTFLLEGSTLALSPESGVERIRHRNKTFSYSNDALMRTISEAERVGIRVDLFFSLGIPGERYEDLKATASFRKEIKRRFKNIGRIWSGPISLEPASPWHLHPEEFGIVLTRRTFLDFYRASSPGKGGLGYFIPGYQGDGKELDEKGFESVIREAKCREFCSLHPNPTKASHPFWGRLFCRYMSWRAKGGHE